MVSSPPLFGGSRVRRDAAGRAEAAKDQGEGKDVSVDNNPPPASTPADSPQTVLSGARPHPAPPLSTTSAAPSASLDSGRRRLGSPARTRTTPPPSTTSTAARCAPRPTRPIPPATDESRTPARSPRSSPTVPSVAHPALDRKMKGRAQLPPSRFRDA